jgi:hypothetical protein
MEYTKTRTVIYRLRPDGYGMKQISIIMKENETGIVLYGRMMVLFLLPMTITIHSMKLLEEEA